ncbi:MAG: hypothetical protein H6851_00125 [Geminicoccaceae bacterium]|nr:hypothetical protein [Geminicoccaceae bacterium]MCB9942016.1 hypothetical protein [Geminicoccaceae bacterium]
MSAIQAKAIEWAIILLCVGSIVLIFQPFSLQLFSIGCVTVVVGALAFNLIPFCRPGVPFRKLANVVGIVLLVLAVAAILGILTAQLYVWYLGTLR